MSHKSEVNDSKAKARYKTHEEFVAAYAKEFEPIIKDLKKHYGDRNAPWDWDALAIFLAGPDVWNDRQRHFKEAEFNLSGLFFYSSKDHYHLPKAECRQGIVIVEIGDELFCEYFFNKSRFENAVFSDLSFKFKEDGVHQWKSKEIGDAFFGGAHFINCSFANVGMGYFAIENIENVRFSNVDFGWTILKDYSLHGTQFLKGSRHYALHGCHVRSTVFDRSISDPWTELRRTYTGVSMILNFALIIAFFAPVSAKALALLAISYGQATTPEATLAYCGVNGCDSIPIWQVLLGFHEPFSFGWFMPVATVILIIYQLLRFWLTREVSVMRENEERSGLTPDWITDLRTAMGESYPVNSVRGFYEGLRRGHYWTLYRVHKVLQFMAVVGFAIFVWRMFQFLFATFVLMPIV